MGSVVSAVSAGFDELTGKASKERKKEAKRVEAKAAAQEQARLDEIETQEKEASEAKKDAAVIRQKKKAARRQRAKTRSGTLLSDIGDSGSILGG